MRFKKPSPSMAVASVALFVSLGGTSVAAVSYARNAGKVDGDDAVKATRARSRRRRASSSPPTRAGPTRARSRTSTWPTSRARRRSARSFEVADNAPGAPVTIGDGGSIGQLTATCNDQAAAAGIEDPITDLNFVNTSGDFINVANRVGVRDDAQVGRAPERDRVDAAHRGSNTFMYHVEYKGRNLLINGVVRQDGRGTPVRQLPRLGHRPGDRSVSRTHLGVGAPACRRGPAAVEVRRDAPS